MSQRILVKRGVKQIKHLSKIDVIIVSVNYNDFLKITLAENKKIFDNITIVTTIDDIECQKICKDFDVKCVITKRLYENGAKFNKGKAINDGIRSLVNPNWILLLDADMIVPSTFKESFRREYTNINSLYVCDRIMFNEYVKYLDWKSGIGKKGPVYNLKGIGYFQLFNINSDSLPRFIYPENSNNAAGSDVSFRNKFKERVDLGIESIHLGESNKNWEGRETPAFIKKNKSYKICSFYFNIKNDPILKKNFLRFIKQFEGRYENLIVGLVDYGDIDFDLPCETLLIKGDVDNKLWSKEIIINKIIDKIDNIDYLMWIDGDLIYDDLNWLDNIEDVVKGNDFVQLFEDINYLNESDKIVGSYKSTCFKLEKDLKPMNPLKISRVENKSDFKPGGAWLGKLSILKEKKLFEKMYVGGGDVIFLYGINNIKEGFTLNKVKESNEKIYNDAINWINSFEGQYKIGYLNKVVNHLYHGDMSDRNYIGRYKKLSKFKNPVSNIVKECSIIIPAYKAKEFISDCIESIAKQKTNFEFEIIIGIDSCEETLEYIKSNDFIMNRCRVVYFEENTGPYLIRNTLITISKYENILFFDADDIMCEGLIKRTAENLIKYESVRWKFENFYDDDINNRQVNKYHAHGVFAIKKEKILKINGFLPWRIGADSEFLERSKISNINIFYDDEVCFYRRQHDNNQTRNKTTGTGSPARLEVQKKLTKMRKEKDFPSPEILNIKKYIIV
jgi:hypothetical protein